MGVGGGLEATGVGKVKAKGGSKVGSSKSTWLFGVEIESHSTRKKRQETESSQLD